MFVGLLLVGNFVFIDMGFDGKWTMEMHSRLEGISYVKLFFYKSNVDCVVNTSISQTSFQLRNLHQK